MNLVKIRGRKGHFGTGLLLVFAFLVLSLGYTSVADAVYSLPSARNYPWLGNVGIPGDIPNRTTICATLNPGDNIQTAINNCPAGQVVKLNAGTYTGVSGLTMKSNVTLRGAGMGQTILKTNGGVSYVVGFNNGFDGNFGGTTYNVTGGNTAGSTSVTLSGFPGWSVGDLILIDQGTDSMVTEHNCTWCGRVDGRPTGQLVKLTAVNGSTITFESPLARAWTPSPQAIKINGVTTLAGIEDLTINDSAGSTDSNHGSIPMFGTDRCWVLRVEVAPVYRIGIYPQASYRSVVRSVKIHDTPIFDSNHGYGIWYAVGNSGNVVEDSIFYNMLLSVTYNGGYTANVQAYNYSTGMHNDNYPNSAWMSQYAHGSFPFYNLFEGNWSDQNFIGGDDMWGGSAYTTYFRNKVTADPSKTQQATLMDVEGEQYYYTFVGNILGTTGLESEYLSYNNWDGQHKVYFFNDTTLSGQALMHANWDSVHNGIIWNGSDDRTLPASMYLASKPTWFGNLAWPAIGPDVQGYATTIPAKVRYEGGTITPAKRPSPPKLLSVQ